MEMSAVGQSHSMLDAQERVSGRINYALNVELPGMLVGRILRSPLPHARIVALDTTRADRLAGVGAVLTRDDFGLTSGYSGTYGRIFRDQSVVALDKVRFVGDPVAAVAAVNEDVAEEALALIHLDYEELPAVFDEEEALKAGAPLVHDPRPQQQPAFSKLIQDLPPGTNVCSHFKLRRGDVESGFRESDFIFEDVFRSPAAQHVALEPHVTVAQFVEGKLTLWTSTQMPHGRAFQSAAVARPGDRRDLGGRFRFEGLAPAGADHRVLGVEVEAAGEDCA